MHMMSSQHVVILRDTAHARYLPIWIGKHEAEVGVHTREAKGAPLSLRIASGIPYSRKAASKIACTRWPSVFSTSCNAADSDCAYR